MREVWTLLVPTEVHVWMGLGGRRHHPKQCGCVGHYTRGRMDVGIAPIEVALTHAYACYPLVRLRLHLIGVAVRTQVTVGGVGRVDFVIEGRVILEADGRDNHDDAANRHRDLMRDAVASDLGFETLRFDYSMILYSWDVVVAAILAALARAHA